MKNKQINSWVAAAIIALILVTSMAMIGINALSVN
jgi:hypothetical protein